MLLAVVPVTGLSLDSFVPLRVVGLGRYASAPAIFLEEEQGGDVLPVPIPGDAVMAVEQALSPIYSAMLEVLLHAQPVSKRDDALFDNVPWAWNPSPQAKRDAFARFSGRGYPREGYQSPYHLMLDTLRRDGCADVSRVLIERTSMLGGLVVGGCLCLERRLPQAEDSGATRAAGAGPSALEDARWWVNDDEGGGFDGSSEPVLCECTTDEALGLAIALRCEVLVEAEVWQAARTAPKYNTQRGKMRLEVWPRMPGDARRGRSRRRLPRRGARGGGAVAVGAAERGGGGGHEQGGEGALGARGGAEPAARARRDRRGAARAARAAARRGRAPRAAGARVRVRASCRCSG